MYGAAAAMPGSASISCRRVRQSSTLLSRAAHLAVRRHAHEAIPQFAFKTVHYGQDDDESRDAQGDAGKRNRGNKGNESGAAFGPEVAKAEEEFNRIDHRPH